MDSWYFTSKGTDVIMYNAEVEKSLFYCQSIKVIEKDGNKCR